MTLYSLDTSVAYLKGVGPQKAEILKKELEISTFRDILLYFPNRYIDRTKFYQISQLNTNITCEIQLKGFIRGVKEIRSKRANRWVGTFEDESGTIELVWFKGGKWIKDNIKFGQQYVIFGKIQFYQGNFSIAHPEMELYREFNKSLQTGLQPFYPSLEKLMRYHINQRFFRAMVECVIQDCKDSISESISANIIKRHELMPRYKALVYIHFPSSQEVLFQAKRRLKFEELFFFQLELLIKKANRGRIIKGYPFEVIGDNFLDFYNYKLSFELTNAQKRVLREIRKDLALPSQMNRLLQGDVGSGKTIVGLLSMLIAIDNNFQACMLAPTEILAAQHFNTIVSLLGSDSQIRVALLTGSTRVKDRRFIHQRLEDGFLDILVGTHAVLEDKVKFNNLGLAIIDEQHRFGVAQRSKMWFKNKLPPHILVMTATPIPRTLAMSAYGDLDISIIDELPPRRKHITTVHKYDSNRLSVFKFIREEIEKGCQVYVVYPLIEESKNLDYKYLMDGYQSIARAFPKPRYQISIVHGQMKADDKEYEMQRFIKGETQIMIATTVIEVGVNIPNASLMIIESAEKFGLSQLHQLRGRVGRGASKSYCILMTNQKISSDAKVRIETMTQSNDGFKIAQVDLKLRGPGNIIGTKQSGVFKLKNVDLVNDATILQLARTQVKQLLYEDPRLSKPENQMILKTYLELYKKTDLWSHIS